MYLNTKQSVLKDRNRFTNGPDEDEEIELPDDLEDTNGGSRGMQHDLLRKDDLDDPILRNDRDSELDDALLD